MYKIALGLGKLKKKFQVLICEVKQKILKKIIVRCLGNIKQAYWRQNSRDRMVLFYG